MKLINRKLGDGIHIKHGFAFLGEYFSDQGKYILLTPGNFYEEGGFKPRPEKDRYYIGTFPSDYLLKKGDLIVAMTEQGPGLLGSSAFIPENNTYLHNQRLGLVDEINKDIFDKKYLYHLFNSRSVRSKIYGSATGTKVRHTAPGRIYKVKVLVPDVVKQKEISSIIENYSQLIDINRRRVQLLEETARLLFREWFVYFRFPLRRSLSRAWSRGSGQAGHEKACPVESINSTGVKIVDRAGRKIPIEWDYLPFTKIKLFKKAPLGVPVFTDIRQYCQTSEIDGTSITGDGEEVDYENRPSRADIAPRINTVYFAKMKDTDKVLYFNKGNSDLLEKILLSTGMVGFTTDEKYLGFLFGLLTSYEFVQYKNNFATGATQVSLNDASLNKIKVLLPTLNLVELYSEIVNPSLEECSLLRIQNQKLAHARDLLLPRLMSGAIDPVRYDKLSNGVEV
jgi:type I restriction enzyme S subunit